jgi:hypothetical protein
MRLPLACAHQICSLDFDDPMRCALGRGSGVHWRPLLGRSGEFRRRRKHPGLSYLQWWFRRSTTPLAYCSGMAVSDGALNHKGSPFSQSASTCHAPAFSARKIILSPSASISWRGGVNSICQIRQGAVTALDWTLQLRWRGWKRRA